MDWQAGTVSSFRLIRVEFVAAVHLYDITDAGERNMGAEHDIAFLAHGLQERHTGLVCLFLVIVEGSAILGVFDLKIDRVDHVTDETELALAVVAVAGSMSDRLHGEQAGLP